MTIKCCLILKDIHLHKKIGSDNECINYDPFVLDEGQNLRVSQISLDSWESYFENNSYLLQPTKLQRAMIKGHYATFLEWDLKEGGRNEIIESEKENYTLFFYSCFLFCPFLPRIGRLALTTSFDRCEWSYNLNFYADDFAVGSYELLNKVFYSPEKDKGYSSFSQKDLEEIRTIYSKLKQYEIFSNKHDNGVSYNRVLFALSRVSYIEKPFEHEVGELFLEYMMAFESIFIKPGEPCIGKKISERASQLLAESKDEEIGLKSFYKKAYALRSKYAHGENHKIEGIFYELQDLAEGVNEKYCGSRLDPRPLMARLIAKTICKILNEKLTLREIKL